MLTLPADAGVREFRPRPYWHVDAKWIAGLLLLPVVTAALLMTILVHVTSEQVAIPLMSTVAAAMFSPAGLDDPGDIEAVRQEMRAKGLDRVNPLPGLNVGMTAADVERLSPRELRIGIFRQIVEPVYREGPAGVKAVAADPATAEKMEADVGLLGIINHQLHLQLQRVLIYFWVAAAVLVALLAYFSTGFGRLVSAGVVLLFACLPGAVLVPMVLQPGREAVHPSEGGSAFDLIGAYVLPEIAPVVTRVYRGALLAALLLFAAALVGRVAWAIVKRVRQRRAHSDAA